MSAQDPNSAIFYLLKSADQQDQKLDSIRNDLTDIKVRIALIEQNGVPHADYRKHSKDLKIAGVAGGGMGAAIIALVSALLKHFGISV